MAKEINLRNGNVVSKSQLTKNNMLAFMREEPKEEIEWFVNLMRNNQVEKKSNLDNKTVNGYDMKVVREEFAKKYFYEISQEYKDKNKKTFDDELEDLLALAS